MVKTLSKQKTATTSDETKKQRKKEAKQEAKAMLALEQARKDVQKAEQKVTKAQEQLKASKTHVHDLEAEIAKLRAPQNHTGTNKKNKKASTRSSSVSTDSPPNAENHTPISSPTNQVSSLPPAEGRADIAPAQETTAAQNANDASSSAEQAPSLPPAEGRTDLATNQESSAHAPQSSSDTPEPALIGNAMPHVEAHQEAAQPDNIAHTDPVNALPTSHDDAEAETEGTEEEQTPHRPRRSTRRRPSPEHSHEEGQEHSTTEETNTNPS